MSLDRTLFDKSRADLLAAVRNTGAPAHLTTPLCERIVATFDTTMSFLERADRIQQAAATEARAFTTQAVELGFLDAYPDGEALRGGPGGEDHKP